MKQLKLTLIALFALVTVGSINAQDSDNPWTIGLGVNAIDFKGDSDFEDLIGSRDKNISEFISRLSVGRYLNNGFSLNAAITLNRINHVVTDGDSDFQYYAFDINGRYDLNELFGETGWFDPYATVGLGYAEVDDAADASDITYNYGFGANFWFNENVGISTQVISRTAFGDDIEGLFQTSVGVVFKFGGK